MERSLSIAAGKRRNARRNEMDSPCSGAQAAEDGASGRLPPEHGCDLEGLRETKEMCYNGRKMRKPKIYIETSVWNHLFADDAPKQRKDTEALFEEIEAGRYEIYISELVLDELDATPDQDLRNNLRDAVRKHQPEELSLEQDVITLARHYLESGIIPPSARVDAFHIAVASVEEVDVLVSLNMRHIVRLKTRRGINGVNRLEGYRDLEIATPEEVLGYGEV
jgi:predicted nucleic acid-binding protein